MSRTIRRKNQKHEYAHVLWDLLYAGNDWVHFCHERHSLEGRCRIRRFHSDGYESMQMVPKHFRQTRNRIHRAQAKQKIRQFLHSGDLNDGPVLPVHKQDARYYWW